MRKTVKYIGIAIAALLALLLAAAAIIAATFDPNDYKPLLIRLAQERTQRTLSIPGDIKLSFFPKIGIGLGEVSISEPGSNAEFASLDSATLSLELIPLLSKQLVVDRIRVDGLRADIKRFKDGSTNVDDLLSGKEAGGQPIRFDIDSVAIDDAHLVFDDRQGERRFEIANLELETDQIANGVPSKLRLAADIKGKQPEVNARVTLDSGFTLDLIQRRYALKRLDAELKGSLAGFTGLVLKAGLSGALSGDDGKLLFTSPQLALSLSGKRDGSVIGGSLSTPVSANLKTQVIDLPKLAADFTLPKPGGGTLALKAGGKAGINLARQTASAVLDGSFDQSPFKAKLGLAGFSPPMYTFDIGIDRLDLDRYRSQPASAPAPAAASTAPATEQPMDFAALRKLQAKGSVRIDALKVANIHASNVRFDLRAGGGRLEVSPFAASLYGGRTNGALTVTAGNPARIALRQNLAGISVGPLLKDALGKDPVEGKGNVQLDVSTRAATFSQIRKGLNGTARLELRDGAIRGVNIAQAVREAKAKIDMIRGRDSQQAGTASPAEKTDFSELSGSFRIAAGVARNDDLDIKSPLIRVRGSGEIDLGNERLDYLARTTVVSTLQGQGGPELQALKGVTVPVKLSGPFSAIDWRVDVAGMASELAKREIDERKEELKAKAQKSLEEEKAKLPDQLKERLRGLFGK